MLSVAQLTEQEFKVEFGQQSCLTGTHNRGQGVSVELRRTSVPAGYRWSGVPQSRQPRGEGVSVELRRRSGTYSIQMVRCAAKSSTVSPLTLSETVESPESLRAIADVAKPVQGAGNEISKGDRDARVKKAPAKPSELESELHSATHTPFRA